MTASEQSGIRREPAMALHGDAYGTAAVPRRTRAPNARSGKRINTIRGDWSRLHRWSLSLLILVFVGRIQEAVPIPGLSSLPLGNVAVLLCAVAIVKSGYHRDFGRLLQTRLGVLGAAFLGVAVLSVPFALWPGGAARGLVSFLTVSVLYVLVVLSVRRPEHLAYLASVFAIAVAILVSFYVKDWLVGGGAMTEQEFVAFDRNDVALLAVMGIPFALVMTVGGGFRAWVGFGLAAFLALGVVTTDSRGGFLALAVMGTVMLAYGRMLSAQRKVTLVLVGTLALLAGGSSEYWERIEAVFTSPSADYNFTDRDGRIEIWRRGAGYFLENPLTGVGIDNFRVAEGQSLSNDGFGVKWNTAHSAYILAAAELGIGGIALFLALLWSIGGQAKKAAGTRRQRRSPPEKELAAVAEATRYSLVGFVVAALFLSVTYNVAFVFLVAVGASLSLLTRTTAGSGPRRPRNTQWSAGRA